MTVAEEDLDRVLDDYTDPDNLTQEAVEQDLADAGFEGSSRDAFAEGIAGKEDMAVSQDALNQAQRQAVESLGDGGAVGGQLVRGEGGKTIGSPQNVSQEIERTGETTGDVIAVNRNTGTRGKIGEVELAPKPKN